MIAVNNELNIWTIVAQVSTVVTTATVLFRSLRTAGTKAIDERVAPELQKINERIDQHMDDEVNGIERLQRSHNKILKQFDKILRQFNAIQDRDEKVREELHTFNKAKK